MACGRLRVWSARIVVLNRGAQRVHGSGAVIKKHTVQLHGEFLWAILTRKNHQWCIWCSGGEFSKTPTSKRMESRSYLRSTECESARGRERNFPRLWNQYWKDKNFGSTRKSKMIPILEQCGDLRGIFSKFTNHWRGVIWWEWEEKSVTDNLQYCRMGLSLL